MIPTLPASRRQRDSVGCGNPVSSARAPALRPFGGNIFCTIFVLNDSLYSTTGSRSSPLSVQTQTPPECIR